MDVISGAVKKCLWFLAILTRLVVESRPIKVVDYSSDRSEPA